MSVHIGTKPGEIADKILLLRDPLQAKYIARTFLENPVYYSQVHGMSSYTGTYKGQRVPVQGIGMRTSLAGIYIYELVNPYDAKKLIRVGTCGSISGKVNVRELVIAQVAAVPSSTIRSDLSKYNPLQIASFGLLLKSHEIAKVKGSIIHTGNVLSGDVFYKDDLGNVFRLGRYEVLAIEMEAAMLCCLAVRFDVEVLAIITVSNGLVTGEETTTEERQAMFNEMIEVGLETAIAN